VNFFTGQLLTADDLRAEQDYVRELHRRHVRTCHGWGVVEGLHVASATGDHRLLVEPGTALSPRGDEICVPDRVEVTLEPLAAAHAAAYVAIRAIETKVNPVPLAPSAEAEDAAVEWSRVQESFELAILDALPPSHLRAGEVRPRPQVLWRTVRSRLSALRRSGPGGHHHPAETPAATPEDDWVVLAHVTRTRLAGGADHIRLVRGARRNVR
jgi:hypothetical protein